ncbi:uncharacterized protein SCODWIG_03209 [Saccharomycodes ludwigii]|uniref:37S ribosomal protein MRP13, mitochondrial n=1 Tax=Saccharomycodes ludwigii TaxID=36035 RepID=A0A376B9T4_9ASCO|nr:hypothetical protein SCDLUD_000512 [Saccharomycodes ludwigii]KAH3902917.1 hypothetical protein SCDLUD_000512 [Saccharomycodes ludwigii]SSD61448.1 uncharacterized protein SCODWIG_03209 [Saccharomycodes ludwigii]
MIRSVFCSDKLRLVIRRHNSTVVNKTIASINENTEAFPYQTVLNDFFQYIRTPKNLKPLIYRPKNKNLLFAMDLKDKKTNKPLQPRDPFKVPSKSVLTQFIWESKDPSSIKWLINELEHLNNRKSIFWTDYFSGTHVRSLILSSYFKHSGVLSSLAFYFVNSALRTKFVQNKNKTNIGNVYNMEDYLVPSYTVRLSKKNIFNCEPNVSKLVHQWNFVKDSNETTGLAKLLIKQLLGEKKALELGFIKKWKDDVTLPTIDVVETSLGKCADYLHKQKSVFFTCRTLIDSGLQDNKEISRFIEEYKACLAKTKRVDLYDEVVNNLKISHENIQKEGNKNEQKEPEKSG